jgi:hypothetical protein
MPSVYIKFLICIFTEMAFTLSLIMGLVLVELNYFKE